MTQLTIRPHRATPPPGKTLEGATRKKEATDATATFIPTATDNRQQTPTTATTSISIK